MRTLNEKDEEVTNPDLTLGYIKEDGYNIHHDAVPAVEGVMAKVHYEVVKEYPNGGKEVKEVVDVPGVEPRPAIPEYDTTETINRYILYTEEELARLKAQKEEEERIAKLPTQDARITAVENLMMEQMLGSGK